MQLQTVWLKPGIWGVVVGSILTMIVGFSWGGWATSGTVQQMAARQADAAVTAVLVPICVAGQTNPNRAVAEACASALVKPAVAK
jgi:hypothetical protein